MRENEYRSAILFEPEYQVCWVDELCVRYPASPKNLRLLMQPQERKE